MIVEDHGLIAQTLAAAMRLADVDVVIADLDDVVAHVQASHPDLVLLDLDLGSRGSSLPLITTLVEIGASVLMVTGVENPVRHAECIAAGAIGVVSKAVSFDELCATVGQALERGSLLSQHDRERYLQILRLSQQHERERLAPYEQLTPREQAVLGGMVEGLTVTEIAEDAVVSVLTVRSQVRSILSKLGVTSQVAAIGRARADDWTPPWIG